MYAVRVFQMVSTVKLRGNVCLCLHNTGSLYHASKCKVFLLYLQRRLWHITPASEHAPPGVYEQFVMAVSLPAHLTLLYTVGPLPGPNRA